MSRVGYIFGYRGRLIGARSSRCAASLDVTVVETKVWWRPRNMNPRPPPYKDRLLSERSAPRAGVLFATRSDRSWPIMCLATRLATASAWSEPSLSQLPDRRPALTGSRVDDREATPSGALDEGRAGPRLAANPGEGRPHGRSYLLLLLPDYPKAQRVGRN